MRVSRLRDIETSLLIVTLDIFSTSVASIDRKGRVQINDNRCSKAHTSMLSIMVSVLGWPVVNC